MAEWNWHIKLASDVAKIVGYKNLHDFLLGSLVPDLPWGFEVSVQNQNGRNETHCIMRLSKGYATLCNVPQWITEHGAYIGKDGVDLYNGILTHIILDSKVGTLWNGKWGAESATQARLHKNPDEIMSKYAVSEIKWNDVALFAYNVIGDQRSWLKGGLKLSDQAVAELKHHFALDDGAIQTMPGKIDGRMHLMLEHSSDQYYFSESTYSAIHDMVVAECAILINSL